MLKASKATLITDYMIVTAIGITIYTYRVAIASSVNTTTVAIIGGFANYKSLDGKRDKAKNGFMTLTPGRDPQPRLAEVPS